MAHSPNSNNPSGERENNEMTIQLRVKRTFTVNVNKNDPIKKLRKIFHRDGVSDSLQSYTFAEQSLKDDQTFSSYGIDSDSTINVELNTNCESARRFLVKQPNSGRFIVITATDDDTVLVLKSMAVLKAGYDAVDQFDLMYNGVYLKSHETIGSQNVRGNMILFLVHRPNEVITINVGAYMRNRVTLQVKKSQTIGEVKSLVANMMMMYVDATRTRLMSTIEKELKDKKTIGQYKISNNQTLILLIPFRVNVRLWNGMDYDLQVMPNESVNSVKNKIKAKIRPTHNEEFDLLYGEIRMDISLAVGRYRLMTGSRLRATPVPVVEPPVPAADGSDNSRVSE